MERDVIIACDFDSENRFKQFIQYFRDKKPFLKVGYQLFYATNKAFINQLIQNGYRIFLDLKLHDIPNTVRNAIKELSNLGVNFITVHASGGIKMMEAAVEATKNTNTKILAVTQLTSINQATMESELLIDRKLPDVVYHYALNALHAGTSGIVCSAQEAKYVKEKISNDLICVCPGIRMDESKNDQHRIATPKIAYKNKVDYIVVGRPITQAKNPLKAYHQYCQEFQIK
ncbi:MAG: orotidine-5'-phosphate decarboxylase [Mycoplasmataceae bacterium]|jgi:orotidine-5'-phosphate decarboxylase|nr:orotidine-5'-phosphate decarboxylase [Mycoplasmataceae bacterium]